MVYVFGLAVYFTDTVTRDVGGFMTRDDLFVKWGVRQLLVGWGKRGAGGVEHTLMLWKYSRVSIICGSTRMLL